MIKIKIKDVELTMEEAKELHGELDKLFGQQNSPAIPGLPSYPYPSYPWYPNDPFTIPGTGYPPIITYTTSGTITTDDMQ